jgi:pilus assembly protein CpaB
MVCEADMVASRLIIAGVAVIAAGGAGYVAKNMTAPPPPMQMSQEPAAPAVETSEVLALAGDVPMGSTVDGQLAWVTWPRDSINENFVTKDGDPEALEKLQGSVARVNDVSGRAAAQIKADRQWPAIHVVDPASRQARHRNPDRS